MRTFLANVLLALAWLAVTGDFTFANFLLGFFAGTFALWVAGEVVGAHGYSRRLRAAVELAAVFAWELLVATLRVAHDVLTPGIGATPAVVALDLEAHSDMELLLISSLVTLTPGTVVVHVTEDRERMYVYGMYVEDAERFRRRIQRVFERRILAVTRA